jgi:thymidylate synthase ThyX
MQRWIVLGALVLSLLGGGLMFGYWKHHQNRPDRQWVPIPFNPESTEAQRDKSVEELRKALLTDTVLTGIVRDCGIEAKWKLQSEQAAVEELKRRVIIEKGETVLKGIPTATLNIGFKGVVGEQPELRSLAERMIADVQRLVTPSAPQRSTPAAANSSTPKF